MNWKQLKALLASGRHHYDIGLLEASPLGLQKYAVIARDVRMRDAILRAGKRFRTLDNTATAIPFRMPVGSPGEVNRYHPFSVEPVLIDASAPPTAYGQAVIIDPTTQGVRPFVAGDQALTDAYGVTVRPFPTQQTSGGMTASFGGGTPPVSGVMDVLRNGYITILFNNSGSAPVKGAQTYLWTAATSGAHIQGGWETAAPAGNGCLIGTTPRTTYQGGWDANNVGELIFHV